MCEYNPDSNYSYFFNIAGDVLKPPPYPICVNQELCKNRSESLGYCNYFNDIIIFEDNKGGNNNIIIIIPIIIMKKMGKCFILTTIIFVSSI